MGSVSGWRIGHPKEVRWSFLRSDGISKVEEGKRGRIRSLLQAVVRVRSANLEVGMLGFQLVEWWVVYFGSGNARFVALLRLCR